MSKSKVTKFDRHTEINTAFIVEKLSNEQKGKYNNEVMENIIAALEFTISRFGSHTHIERFYYENKEHFKKEHPELQFSFPHYFCYLHDYSENMVVYPSFIHVYKYSEPCILTLDDLYFDFFFALYFSMIDKNQAKEFLKYHLRYNFESDLSKFITFLHKTSYDNSKFLNKNWLLDIDALDNLDENLNEILALNNGKIIKSTPKSFEEIFVVTDWNKYIDVLYKIDIPVINSNYEFIGKSQKHKGVICSWIKDLQTKGTIDKKYNRKQLATVLNNGIKNLNLGKDGKTFDNYSKEYMDNYKAHLLKLVN